MSISNLEILIRHNLIALPSSQSTKIDISTIATILNNIAYYGYSLSEKAYEKVINSGEQNVATWWKEVEKV